MDRREKGRQCFLERKQSFRLFGPFPIEVLSPGSRVSQGAKALLAVNEQRKLEGHVKRGFRGFRGLKEGPDAGQGDGVVIPACSCEDFGGGFRQEDFLRNRDVG